MNYTGRFAPSPSGPLHPGSLLAALASYLDAKANNGTWLVRIEDIDTLRNVPGATDSILNSLIAHGLIWDGDVLYQSSRIALYNSALEKLQEQQGQIYFCNCSRKKLKALPQPFNTIYPGYCRAKIKVDYRPPSSMEPASHALRYNTQTDHIQRFNIDSFHDHVFGEITVSYDALGDFIVKRRDGIIAYQLAVVVDDIDQGITHVVRGADLLHATPWQIALFNSLKSKPPLFAHLPLIVKSNDGAKLSKQTGATALDDAQAFKNIKLTLKYLNQKQPPDKLKSVEELLHFAILNWDIQRVNQQNISV